MTTISIDETDHEALCRLAEETGKPLGALLHDAIVRYRREALLEANNAAYERLMQDPTAFQEELEEQKLWEHTLADGLKDWVNETPETGRDLARRSRPHDGT